MFNEFIQLSELDKRQIISKLRENFNDFQKYDELIQPVVIHIVSSYNNSIINLKNTQNIAKDYLTTTIFNHPSFLPFNDFMKKVFSAVVILMISYHHSVHPLKIPYSKEEGIKLMKTFENHPEFQELCFEQDKDEEIQLLFEFRKWVLVGKLICEKRSLQKLLFVAGRLSGSKEELITGGVEGKCSRPNVRRRLLILRESGFHLIKRPNRQPSAKSSELNENNFKTNEMTNSKKRHSYKTKPINESILKLNTLIETNWNLIKHSIEGIPSISSDGLHLMSDHVTSQSTMTTMDMNEEKKSKRSRNNVSHLHTANYSMSNHAKCTLLPIGSDQNLNEDLDESSRSLFKLNSLDIIKSILNSNHEQSNQTSNDLLRKSTIEHILETLLTNSQQDESQLSSIVSSPSPHEFQLHDFNSSHPSRITTIQYLINSYHAANPSNPSWDVPSSSQPTSSGYPMERKSTVQHILETFIDHEDHRSDNIHGEEINKKRKLKKLNSLDILKSFLEKKKSNGNEHMENKEKAMTMISVHNQEDNTMDQSFHHLLSVASSQISEFSERELLE